MRELGASISAMLADSLWGLFREDPSNALSYEAIEKSGKNNDVSSDQNPTRLSAITGAQCLVVFGLHLRDRRIYIAPECACRQEQPEHSGDECPRLRRNGG